MFYGKKRMVASTQTKVQPRLNHWHSNHPLVLLLLPYHICDLAINGFNGERREWQCGTPQISTVNFRTGR